MSAVLTPAMQAFDAWWTAQSKLGDPARRTHLSRDAFYAGWSAALEAHPARDDRRPPLHGSITLGAPLESPDECELSFTELFGEPIAADEFVRDLVADAKAIALPRQCGCANGVCRHSVAAGVTSTGERCKAHLQEGL